MTTQLETIDGVQYLVTRDEKGNIVRMAGAENSAPPAEGNNQRRARLLIATLQDKVFRDSQTLTALERDQAIVAILTFTYYKSI